MNRRAEMISLLEGALKKPDGIVLKVLGDSPGKRQSAISALSALRRELLPDNAEMLDLVIKPIPGRPDEIAIRRLNS